MGFRGQPRGRERALHTCRIANSDVVKFAIPGRNIPAGKAQALEVMDIHEGLYAGQFKATSPDLTLNGGLYSE